MWLTTLRRVTVLALVLTFGSAWAPLPWPLSIAEPARLAADERSAPSYQRHVMALFGKLGCNGGTCHGAVKGQGGFRLSMFGADPAGDYERITREFAGRRVNLIEPAASLLLVKATGGVPHGGGRRVSVGSADYQVLLAWVADGAGADELEPSRLTALRIAPIEHLAGSGESYALQVTAEFADGRTEDVTGLCSYESLDKSVAAVNAAGIVTATGVGDAGLLVRYRSQPAAARIVVPNPRSQPAAVVAPANFIDQHVLAKLAQLNLPAAELCDDATFLRRVYLDVLGRLPSADEVREFLDDASADKRTAKIDELLAHPAHADLWALKFCDLLKAADFGVYADAMSQEHDAPRMQAWIRARLVENTPYDELVARILTATSREGRSMEEYAGEVQALFEGYAPGRPDLARYAQRRTLDLFWQRRGSDGVKGAMQVAHAFLGLRLECAQCHRHPHDNWQQEDLLDFANFFMRVRTVGFQGDNEKKFADAAEFFRRYNDEGKSLEATVKQRKEGEGKTHDEAAKKAKATIDKLRPELAKLEKADEDAAEIARLRQEIAQAQEAQSRAEAYRQETAEIEKRAKQLPEVARRLMQAECRLLPKGALAKVTSTLGTRESQTFRLLGESAAVTPAEDADPRELVVAWLRRPDNPYFARALVNRVWAHYFGRGIVDPPDNLSAFNPATHPELLQELADRFVAGGYDLRWLHRTLVGSRTYQQSSTPAAGAETDRTHYAFFPLRRLSAEVLLDALNQATGTTENMDMKYYHWPERITTVQAPYVPRNAFVAFVLQTFGRPQRNAAVQCDCERDPSGSIFQVLTLANHPRVWEKVNDPLGQVAQVVKSEPDADRRVDELFLAALSRMPTDDERAACRRFVDESDKPEAALRYVLWGLLNTREFLLQH